MTTEAFGMDSSGRPVARLRIATLRPAQALATRLIGGAAAAAAGPSLGTGLLWPTAASTAPFSIPPPRPVYTANFQYVD